MKPLTSRDMSALARIARNFVEAHERRNQEYVWPTISERAALDSLRANIASLDAERRHMKRLVGYALYTILWAAQKLGIKLVPND